jgi:hypothetical protein
LTIAEQIKHLSKDEAKVLKPEFPAIYSGLTNYQYHSCDDESESATSVKALLISRWNH